MALRTTVIKFVWEDHAEDGGWDRPDEEIDWDYYLRMGDIDCESAEVLPTVNPIIRLCEEQGVTLDRLEPIMGGSDNWGKMVHAFEYLTVLGAVLAVMKGQA